MVIYICKKPSSDVFINGEAGLELSQFLGTSESVLVTVSSGGAQNIHFVTPQGTPSSDAWESGGSMTMEVNITAVTGNLRARCRVRRIDSNGSVLQNGVFNAFQNLTAPGMFNFTMTVPTWTTAEEACGNRILVTLSFDNTAGGGGTATMELGTANAEVNSPITENSANCRRIFIS